MFSKLKHIVGKVIFKIKNYKNTQNYYDLLKMALLGSAFFFIIGTYSILRPLKTSVFLGLIGKEYQPLTKLISLIILLPFLVLYAKLVDKLRRYQVVYFFLGFYIVGITLSAITLWHPIIGLNNTNTNPYRIFGWIFYIFIDLYAPLVVATFWAFANSINTPEYAKKNYGRIVACSKVAGITTPLISWFILQKTNIPYTTSIPILLFSTSFLLVFSGVCISKIMKKIPGYYLHGYEAVYKVEKKQKHKQTGLMEGLKLILKQPYVLGIFGIVYLYEAVSIIIDYQMQVLMSIENQNAISGMSSFMFLYTASFQTLGLFFALFGTAAVLRRIGVKFSLVIMPLATILLMFVLFSYPSLASIFIIMVLLRAGNYGFNIPVREILYIPTTKDIKFKSKAWIESFGRSLSKTSGSTYNYISQIQNSILQIKYNSLIAVAISALWAIIAIFVGKKYHDTVENNAVIGQEELDKDQNKQKS